MKSVLLTIIAVIGLFTLLNVAVATFDPYPDFTRINDGGE